MLKTAIEMRRLDRFTAPFAFRQRDIVEYLPVQDIAPWAESWKELQDEFLAQHGGRWKKGDGEIFKRGSPNKGARTRFPGSGRLPSVVLMNGNSNRVGSTPTDLRSSATSQG